MSIAELIPAVQALSRSEKDLAREAAPVTLKEGEVFPIYTPEYVPHAAAQLAKLLNEEAVR